MIFNHSFLYNAWLSFFLLACAVTGSSAQSAPVLDYDQSVSHSIQHDEEHAYTLEAEAGHHVDIELAQRGINLGITVSAPDGAVLAAGDHQRHVYAPERIGFDLAEGGTYRIRLTPQPGYAIETGLDANAFVWDGERRVPYEQTNDSGSYT